MHKGHGQSVVLHATCCHNSCADRLAQPISGGLDFASSAFEGTDATKDQLIGRPQAGTTNRRLRLPRTIGGDGKVTAFLGSDATEKEVGYLAPTMPHLSTNHRNNLDCLLACATAP